MRLFGRGVGKAGKEGERNVYPSQEGKRNILYKKSVMSSEILNFPFK
jgi:hypothetical protein